MALYVQKVHSVSTCVDQDDVIEAVADAVEFEQADFIGCMFSGIEEEVARSAEKFMPSRSRIAAIADHWTAVADCMGKKGEEGVLTLAAMIQRRRAKEGRA